MLLPAKNRSFVLNIHVHAIMRLVIKGKEEVSSFQEDLQEANRQREQLEKHKEEVQGQLEEIDNQVSGG